MNPVSCVPTCSNSPAATQVPGPAGAPGPTIGTTSVYGSGTAYTMKVTPAMLSLGTTPPSLILAQAGTYLIFARARFDAVSATMTTQTLTTKLTCINNTVADLANTTRVFDFLPIINTSGTVAEILVPVTAYVATAGDTIQMWGSLSGATGAGTITCVEADIIAVQIAFS